MLKKILTFIIVLIVLLAIGLGVYWFFDKQQTGDTSGNGSDFSFGDFFPFGGENGSNGGSSGNGSTNQTPGGTGTDQNPNPQVPTPAPRLWRISNEPQSGAVVFSASGTPTVRYTDKATGNIFESSLRLLGTNRITNTTIPKVYEAMWQPSGNALVLRYLAVNNETIRSVYGRLASSTVSSGTAVVPTIRELQTNFLPENITDLDVNQSTGAIVYVTISANGSKIYITNSTAGNPREVFESEIRDFSVQWVNNTTIALLSKPSASATGNFYFVKTDTGKLERILGGQNGLSALSSPDGAKVLYSESKNNSSFASTLYSPKTGDKTALSLAALPDKCVWSAKSAYAYCAVPKTIPSASYPDAWYQGRVSFNDTIWRIDTVTGASEFLIDPANESEGEGVEIDATNLMLDPNEDYLVFTNKKDAQLWGLRILKSS